MQVIIPSEMIHISNLTKEYTIGTERIKALDDVSLNVNQGEILSIIGKSGSGKSTLMNILGLLDTATTGKYYFNGKDTSRFEDRILSRIRNHKIGFIFQSFNLIPSLDAFHNVELPLIYQGVDKNRREILTKRALKKLGLYNRMLHKPSEMSGGQQQRVAIARAIVTNANLILADEPTGNLDSTSSEDIIKILKYLNKMGKTVIIITHDSEIARQTDRVISIQDGRIISDKRNYENE